MGKLKLGLISSNKGRSQKEEERVKLMEIVMEKSRFNRIVRTQALQYEFGKQKIIEDDSGRIGCNLDLNPKV